MTSEELEKIEYRLECAMDPYGSKDDAERFRQDAADYVATLISEVRRLKLLVHQQELTGLGAVVLVAEVERLREIETIVRRMVHDDLTVQHPGSDTVRRLVGLLEEAAK